VFLEATGGIPPDVSIEARDWLNSDLSTESPFALAHRLLAGVVLGLAVREVVVAAVDALVATMDQAGGWSPSAELLLPPRHLCDNPGPRGPHADVSGLITTSIVGAGMARWLAALRPG
jgi:hypothetical protein